MKIAVIKEKLAGEKRVAATPDSVKRFVKAGVDVAVESGAGVLSSFSDSDYRDAGATISKTSATALKGADIVLVVNSPDEAVTDKMGEGSYLIGMLNPYLNNDMIESCIKNKISSHSMEFLPRISRAQSMDVLSSQSNLAGYRAVIEAVAQTSKVIPMMMTAAGTITPATILVLGAGVAGLQAIATAKRLGAVVSAFDVRPVVKEQVESLGGKFIEVKDDSSENSETSGGYAKEMSEEYKKKQSELIAEVAKSQDIIISTALIPGRPAPVLITEDMVKSMKSGSVIVDLAAAAGGNCPLTEADKIITKHDVEIIGYTNMPSHAAHDASNLYARNLFNFVSSLMIDEEGKLQVNHEDELVIGTNLTKDGKILMEQFDNKTDKSKGGEK